MIIFRQLMISTLTVVLLSSPQVGPAQTQPEFPVTGIKQALSGVRISGGPDASKLTRSLWGPDLYRRTADAAVLVVQSRGARGSETWISGSGVVISPDCQILTNWHVVEDEGWAAIIFRPQPPRTFSYSDLTKADIYVGRVVKTNQPKDLALLQVERCPAGLKFLPLEDPEQIEVAQEVFAIGHPKDLHWTYTEGVISQIRPLFRWKSGDGRQFIATVIQTQTPISHGSSGGPLINRAGRMVGVISNGIPAESGFNFAISAHEVKFFLGR